MSELCKEPVGLFGRVVRSALCDDLFERRARPFEVSQTDQTDRSVESSLWHEAPSRKLLDVCIPQTERADRLAVVEMQTMCLFVESEFGRVILVVLWERTFLCRLRASFEVNIGNARIHRGVFARQRWES